MFGVRQTQIDDIFIYMKSWESHPAAIFFNSVIVKHDVVLAVK
jgi:hypothetical protein